MGSYKKALLLLPAKKISVKAQLGVRTLTSAEQLTMNPLRCQHGGRVRNLDFYLHLAVNKWCPLPLTLTVSEETSLNRSFKKSIISQNNSQNTLVSIIKSYSSYQEPRKSQLNKKKQLVDTETEMTERSELSDKNLKQP